MGSSNTDNNVVSEYYYTFMVSFSSDISTCLFANERPTVNIAAVVYDTHLIETQQMAVQYIANALWVANNWCLW